MGRDAGAILRDALALPAEARAALAESLLESLDTNIDERAEEEWRAEIKRRTSELDAGRTKAVPWSEVRTRLAKQARG